MRGHAHTYQARFVAALIVALAICAVACDPPDTPGKIVALDLATGEKVWEVDAESPNLTTPVATGDRLLIAGDEDCDHVLVAYGKANGERLWKADISETCVLGRTPYVVGELVLLEDHAGQFAIDVASGASQSWPRDALPRTPWIDRETTDRGVDLVARRFFKGPELWRTTLAGAEYAARPSTDGRFVIVRFHLESPSESAWPDVIASFDAANGVELWRTKAGVSTREQRGSSGDLVDGTLYLDRNADANSTYGSMGPITIEAIDPASGMELWHVDLGPASSGGALASDGAITIMRVSDYYLDDGFVFTTSTTIIAVEAASGRELWRDRRTGSAGQLATPIVEPNPVRFVGDTLYVNRGYTRPKSIEAVDPRTGVIRWKHEADRDLASTSAAGVIVIATGREAVAYEEATGELLWRRKLPGFHFSNAFPTIVDDVVYVAVEGHNIGPWW